MTGVYLCAAMTPAIRWAGLRFPIAPKKRLRRIAIHPVFSFLFSVGELAIHAVILRWLGLFPAVMTSLAATFALLITIGFHQNMLTYWTILGVIYAVRLYRRYQEREKEALRLELSASELRTQSMRAQLGALKSQLQPHFLFNTLNAIMVLVRQQKTQDAEETLVRLSDLLRSVLEDVEAQEVPLRRERFVTFGVMGPGLFGFGVAIATERDLGLLRLKRALPAPPFASLVAKMAMAMLFVAIIMATMIAASRLGPLRFSAGQWARLSAVSIAGTLPFCAMGLLIGTLAGGKSAPAFVNLLYLPMIYLSGFLIPLPASMQSVAAASPAYHLHQLALAAIGAPAQGSPAVHFLVLALLTGIVSRLAVRRLARAA
jgi:ABC-2 type transport system permease protein